jgi:hypothetical protein
MFKTGFEKILKLNLKSSKNYLRKNWSISDYEIINTTFVYFTMNPENEKWWIISKSSSKFSTTDRWFISHKLFHPKTFNRKFPTARYSKPNDFAK